VTNIATKSVSTQKKLWVVVVVVVVVVADIMVATKTANIPTYVVYLQLTCILI